MHLRRLGLILQLQKHFCWRLTIALRLMGVFAKGLYRKKKRKITGKRGFHG